MKPVAWRWTNQFGKDVLSSNHELAKLMEAKGLYVDPLYAERWEDKREQQTANAVDSAPSDCTTALSTGDVQREFYAWWEENQVDRLHGMIAQNCALAAWHDAYNRYVRKETP